MSEFFIHIAKRCAGSNSAHATPFLRCRVCVVDVGYLLMIGGVTALLVLDNLHMFAYTYMSRSRVHKSTVQGLNLSRSSDKPTLVLTIPRTIQSRLQRIYLSQRLKL